MLRGLDFLGLYIFHMLLVIIAIVSVANLASSLPAFGDSSFSAQDVVKGDYGRLRKMALPVVIMDTITCGAALIVLTVDLIRAQPLPLFVEMSWTTAALGMQIANLVLIVQHKPSLTSGSKDINPQHPASLTVSSWQMALAITCVLIVLLAGHSLWHLIVSLRHRTVRPRIFFESTPGNYPWSLKPAPPMPDFPIVTADDYALSSARSVDSETLHEKSSAQLA